MTDTSPPVRTTPEPTSSSVDTTIQEVASAVNTLTESFGKIYERLHYPGFVSVLGAILVSAPLALSKTVFVNMPLDEQRLYVLSGVAFVVVGALWITVQNLLIYKLQRAKQEVACRMLTIRVAAMGETQRAALKAIDETKGEQLNDDPFNTK